MEWCCRQLLSHVLRQSTPQNVYDDPTFFKEYITFPRQVHGLEGAPEWPSIRAILPDLTGKRVIDLGCGFGWFTRWARENGALSALGLDVSEKMLERARSDTTDAAIEYRIQDLEVLELPEASFDFAYSALAFHYIEDFARLVREIYDALTPGSHFVFEIEHPIYMAAYNADWTEFGGGRLGQLTHMPLKENAGTIGSLREYSSTIEPSQRRSIL